jgi:hypothetical protein
MLLWFSSVSPDKAGRAPRLGIYGKFFSFHQPPYNLCFCNLKYPQRHKIHCKDVTYRNLQAVSYKSQPGCRFLEVSSNSLGDVIE